MGHPNRIFPAWKKGKKGEQPPGHKTLREPKAKSASTLTAKHGGNK